MWEVCEICKKSLLNEKYLESDIWCICKKCNYKMNYKDRQRIWLKLKLNFNH